VILVEKKELHIVVYGDSEKVLKKFPDNSIDLLVTSPPYFHHERGDVLA